MVSEYRELLELGKLIATQRSEKFDWQPKLEEELGELELALAKHTTHKTHDSMYLLLLEIADVVAIAAAMSYIYKDSTLLDALTKIRGLIDLSLREIYALVQAKMCLYSVRDRKLLVIDNRAYWGRKLAAGGYDTHIDDASLQEYIFKGVPVKRYY